MVKIKARGEESLGGSNGEERMSLSEKRNHRTWGSAQCWGEGKGVLRSPSWYKGSVKLPSAEMDNTRRGSLLGYRKKGIELRMF